MHAGWLDAYTIYRLLVREYDGDPHWSGWQPDHHSPAAALHWLDVHPDSESLARERDAIAHEVARLNQILSMTDARGVEPRGNGEGEGLRAAAPSSAANG